MSISMCVCTFKWTDLYRKKIRRIYLNEWVDLCLLFRFENSLKKHRTYDPEPFNYATRIKSNGCEPARVCVCGFIFELLVRLVRLFAETIKWCLHIVSVNEHGAHMTCGYGQLRDIVFKILETAPPCTWRTTILLISWITKGWKQDNPIFNKFRKKSSSHFFW